MSGLNRIGAGLLTACIAIGLAAAATATAAAADDFPPVPPTPSPILDVVSIRPFTLDAAATHGWRAERPQYTSGYLMVLRVDPGYVHPRQVAEPVLYVGRQTAERVNRGHESGFVVAIVPGVLDPAHPDHIDFAKAPVWFGTPDMPERIDARTIERELRLAEAAGITPAVPARIADARVRGGALLATTNKRGLLTEATQLIAAYSPQERALIEKLRMR